MDRTRSQEVFEHVGRNRLREQETLQLVAAFLIEELSLGLGFNTLGNDLKSEIASHHNDRAHDRGVFRRTAIADLLDEAAVDLDPRQRIARQITERCIARAEIIESNSDALGAKRL